MYFLHILKSSMVDTELRFSVAQYVKNLYHTYEHLCQIWCFYHKVHNWSA